MNGTLKTLVAEVIEKRKIVKPSEDAFMAVFNEFVKEVKAFVKENKWYDTTNRYCAIAGHGYFYINMIYFSESEENVIWVTIPDDYSASSEDYSFTYEEIENAVKFASLEYEIYAAEKRKNEERWKESRRATLLKELDNLT